MLRVATAPARAGSAMASVPRRRGLDSPAARAASAWLSVPVPAARALVAPKAGQGLQSPTLLSTTAELPNSSSHPPQDRCPRSIHICDAGAEISRLDDSILPGVQRRRYDAVREILVAADDGVAVLFDLAIE